MTEVSALGEFGLIQRLTQRFSTQGDSTIKGVGDDAAVIKYDGEKHTLVSTDMLVEGVHFDLTYVPLKHLGYKKRGYVICYLRDKGYLLNETIQILRTYLSTDEYIHCCTRGMAPGHTTFGEMQPQYFYKSYVRDKISFPGCRKLKMYGECPYQEDYFCEEGKKLYKR